MTLDEIIENVKQETEEACSALAESQPSLSPPNSSFSQTLPFLQLAWDSTSYGNLKICPRYYYYNNVQGRVPREENTHLIWGRIYQLALEQFDRRRANGTSHDESLLAAVKIALIQTWNPKLNRPWTSDEPAKTRETLIRAIIWHIDQYENDPLETLILADGQPAVELSFRFDSGVKSRVTGENFLLCGHLDRVVLWNGKKKLLDHKTTFGSIGDGYFAKFTPDNQVSLYLNAGGVIFREPVLDMIIDACQAQVNGNNFQRGYVSRTQSQLDEWLRDFGVMMRVAEQYAEEENWPMNDKACRMYSRYDGDHDTWRYGCPYIPVCSTPPELRSKVLETMFVRRVWDPLIPRTEDSSK